MCVQQWRPLHIHTHMRICTLVCVFVCVSERLCACLCLSIFARIQNKVFNPCVTILSGTTGELSGNQRPARMQPCGEGTKRPRQIVPATHPPRSSLPPKLRKRPPCPHTRLHATLMYTWIARPLCRNFLKVTAYSPGQAPYGADRHRVGALKE